MAARPPRAVAGGRVVALQEHEVATRPVACGVTSFSELLSSVGACWDSADIAGSVFFDYYLQDVDAAMERHLKSFDDKGGTVNTAVEECSPLLIGRPSQELRSTRSVQTSSPKPAASPTRSSTVQVLASQKLRSDGGHRDAQFL